MGRTRQKECGLVRKGTWGSFKAVDKVGADKLNDVALIVKETGIMKTKPSRLYWWKWGRYFEATGAARRTRCLAWSSRA